MNQQVTQKQQARQKKATAPTARTLSSVDAPRYLHTAIGNHGVLRRYHRVSPQEAGPAPRVTPDIETHIQSLHESGQPLPGTVRALFEQQFGHNLGRVRIHSGTRAAQVTRSLGAEAFTYGDSISFAAGRYRPYTVQGLHLLAHEVAHTIQQSGQPASGQAGLTIGQDDPLERMADRAAAAVLGNEPVPSVGSSRPVIRRKTSYTRIPNPTRHDQMEIVKHSNGSETRYVVVKTVKKKEVTTTRWKYNAPGIKFGWGRENAWIEIGWCQDTHGNFKIGANIPAALSKTSQQLVKAIVSGGDTGKALNKVDLTPFARFMIGKTGWKLFVGAHATISPTGEFRRAGGSVGFEKGGFRIGLGVSGGPSEIAKGKSEIRGMLTVATSGKSAAKVECPKEMIRSVKIHTDITYKCTKFIPAGKKRIKVPVTRTRQQIGYIYFPYKKHKVYPTLRDEQLRDAQEKEIAGLRKLLSSGYSVTRITGYASPEGPLGPGRRFMGNIELAKRRAAAAQRFLVEECAGKPAACATSAQAVTPEGKAEKYTKLVGHEEAKGATLARFATERFLSELAEKRHWKPDVLRRLKEAQARGDTRAMEALVYPFLRRAEILLTKTEKTEMTKEVPTKAEWRTLHTCPPDVLKEAKEAFQLQAVLPSTK